MERCAAIMQIEWERSVDRNRSQGTVVCGRESKGPMVVVEVAGRLMSALYLEHPTFLLGLFESDEADRGNITLKAKRIHVPCGQQLVMLKLGSREGAGEASPLSIGPQAKATHPCIYLITPHCERNQRRFGPWPLLEAFYTGRGNGLLLSAAQ